MASNILIKRSTGATAPGTITYGELAVTIGGNGTQANADDRLFVGDNNGAAQIVGGKYFTDMLDHVAGTLTASSAVVVDSNSKIDNWNVDDINLNGSTITTGTADTDLVIAANGTGKVVIQDGLELEFGTTGDVELVFNDSEPVTVFPATPERLIMVVDGNAGCYVWPEDRVLIRRSDHPVKFVRLSDHEFFQVLRNKLGWGLPHIAKPEKL